MRTISQLLTIILLAVLLGACSSVTAPSDSKSDQKDPPPDSSAPKTPAKAPDDPNRNFDEEGGFSFVRPEGWQLTDIPGLDYEGAIGPSSNGFAPNITVVDETFGGTLDEYVEANVETLQSSFEGFQIVDQGDFRPNEGDNAVRLATESMQQGTRLRQTFYFFDAGSKKFVLTCSRLPSGQEAVDAACDESMETFRVE